MSTNNGVIRVGRKGIKKFAFGEDGEPFEVDVVVVFQEWIGVDEQFRDRTDDGTIATKDIPEYHRAAVEFVESLVNALPQALGRTENLTKVSTAEALDFLARLREQYDELADFFRPKSHKKQDSPDTSEVELRFSAEEPA